MRAARHTMAAGLGALVLLGSAVPAGAVGTGSFPTIVGGPGRGPALTTSVNAEAVATMPGGTSVAVADGRLDVVRQINLTTGTSSVIAGVGASGDSGDGGPATAAELVDPTSVAYGPDGTLYIADPFDHRVRAVSPAGIITTFAGTGTQATTEAGDGGQASAAQLGLPQAVAWMPGEGLLIADRGLGDLRLVSTSGVISLAATGFDFPAAMAVSGTGATATVYVADNSGDTNTVDSVTGVTATTTGTTAVYAGQVGRTGDLDGPRQTAEFNGPNGLAFDASGDLLVADAFSGELRSVNATTGVVTTVAGTGMTGFSGDGGTPATAEFSFVAGVTVLGNGSLVLCDSDRLREITGLTTTAGVSSGGTVETVAGDGNESDGGNGGRAVDSQLNQPGDVAVDPAGDVAVADTGNNEVRLVKAGTGTTSTLVSLGQPLAVAWDGADLLVLSDDRVYSVTPSGAATVVAGGGTAVPGDGGPATGAQFDDPFDIAVGADGTIYVADTAHNTVRAVSTSGVITTIAGDGSYSTSGDGGPATAAGVPMPTALAVLPTGQILVASAVDDDFYGAHVVREFTPGGIVSTFAGGPTSGYSGDGGPATSATFAGIQRIAVGPDGSVYLADAADDVVRRVAPGGIVSTVAGNGTAGFAGPESGATSPVLSGPFGVAVDPSGDLLIADTGNDRIREQAVVAPPAALPETAAPVLLGLAVAGLLGARLRRSRRRNAPGAGA